MRLRYVDVPQHRGHYESVFLTLVHPDQPQALWVRTTVKKRPGAAAVGALWVTWFAPGGVRAGKLDDLPIVGTEALTCGPAVQGPSSSRGQIDLDSLTARWDVRFASKATPLEHLRPSWLYRAPLPRTKATTPCPDFDVTGTLVVDGTAVDLTGWTGMLGHNWGTEHAARWVWLRSSGLGDDQNGWLDVVLGRVRIGPVLAPWTAFGALSLDGKVHRLGGLLGRRAQVETRSDGAIITAAGPDLHVEVDAEVRPEATVGWEYADPNGHRHEVVNSSVAVMTVRVRTADGFRSILAPVRRGVLEIGADERAFDVALQPDHD